MRRPGSTALYAPLFPYLELTRGAVLAPGELVIDNFAGLGGASTGLEQALGRPVDVAINHDRNAVEMHAINHPHTRHYIEDVWQVDPLEVTGGQPVALAWFSPDCKHFSKAKGDRPVTKKIRGLAWVAVRWADLVKPRVIILENVEEFQTWGPLTAEGRPDQKQKGRTFSCFVNALRYQGYEVEWRELRACGYGAPTIRKRLFLIARRDGQPIVWPQPTHGAPTDVRVKAGDLKPFRTAAECIDWELPTPSIFTRRKALVPATMRRIARGIQRFVLDAAEPFIVTCNHGGETFRGQGMAEPMRTITAAHDAHGLTVPHLTRFNTGSIGSAITQPAPPVMAGGTPARESTGNPHGLVTANLVTYYGQKREGEVRGQSMHDPVRTQTTENRHGLVSGYLVPRYGEREGQAARVVSLADPSPTIVTTANGSRLAAVSLIKHYGGTYQGAGVALGEPVHTLTAVDHHGLLAAHLTAYYGQNGNGDAGQAADEPMRTIPTVDRFGPVCATLMRQFGTSTAADVAAPVGTITTCGQGKTGVVTADCLPALDHQQLDRAREVYRFLASFAPEALARHGDHHHQLVLVTVAGELYVLADIGMRMLTPRELARCQGFPESYRLDAVLGGRPLSKAAQVRGIGNSVCPDLARVIAQSQLTLPVPAQEAAD